MVWIRKIQGMKKLDKELLSVEVQGTKIANSG